MNRVRKVDNPINPTGQTRPHGDPCQSRCVPGDLAEKSGPIGNWQTYQGSIMMAGIILT